MGYINCNIVRIISIFLFLLLHSSNVIAEKFTIGVNDAYANSVGKERVAELFEVMYRPLGIVPEIRFYPSKRGLRLANRDFLDAEAGRVLRVAKEYSELIPILEPMVKHDVGYFCIESERCIRSLDAIYSLSKGFVGGEAYCEENNLQCLSEHDVAFSVGMLANGVIDAVIGSITSTLSSICQSNISQVFYRSEKQLEIISYHLINKKHANKAPALEASIRAMHKRGDFIQFVSQNSKINPECRTKLVKL